MEITDTIPSSIPTLHVGIGLEGLRGVGPRPPVQVIEEHRDGKRRLQLVQLCTGPITYACSNSTRMSQLTEYDVSFPNLVSFSIVVLAHVFL